MATSRGSTSCSTMQSTASAAGPASCDGIGERGRSCSTACPCPSRMRSPPKSSRRSEAVDPVADQGCKLRLMASETMVRVLHDDKFEVRFRPDHLGECRDAAGDVIETVLILLAIDYE